MGNGGSYTGMLRTRPLFPYPQFTKYSGTGDPNDAANFVAATPAR